MKPVKKSGLERFLKGIVVGFGGIAPGLSGSILLIIFGLYQQTLEAFGKLFSDFRKHIRFLLPLAFGMILGVLLFSNVIDFCLENFEMPTRFCFLGLILGTLPTVWREVRKEGIHPWCWAVILLTALGGTLLFTVNAEGFPQVADPNLLQKILLGVAVAATAIIPGVDPAVFLSALGFYEMYVSALADLNFGILLPMALGLAAGAVVISAAMTWLFSRFYTLSYCVIFGIFISMIPHMLTAECIPGLNGATAVSLALAALGFAVSWYLGDFHRNRTRIQALLKKYRKRG